MAQKEDLVGVGVTPEAADILGANVVAVTAAGSAITDAGSITAKLAVVSGADGTKGAILPTWKKGDIFYVKNAANAVLKLYPASASHSINGGTAGASVSLAAYEMAILFADSATNCQGGVAVVF
jgi:hypothetical protein